MPITAAVLPAVIGGAAKVAGGAIAASGAKKAADVQDRAAQENRAFQREMFQKQIELQEPFRQAGLTAQQQIMQLLGVGGDANAPGYGSLAKPFGMDQFNVDPGYAFRQSEGMKALERSAAARGGLLSGSAMKGIQRFGQDLASQEYQNAFNRYQVERSARLNPLQSLMGSGQSATNVMTSATGQTAQAQGQDIYNAAQARASGYVGSANALGGAFGSVGQAITDYPLYNAMAKYYDRGAPGDSGGSGLGGRFGTGYNPNTGTMSFGGPTTQTPFGTIPGGLGKFS